MSDRTFGIAHGYASLRRQAHAVEEYFISRVGAEGVKHGIYFYPLQNGVGGG